MNRNAYLNCAKAAFIAAVEINAQKTVKEARHYVRAFRPNADAREVARIITIAAKIVNFGKPYRIVDGVVEGVTFSNAFFGRGRTTFLEPLFGSKSHEAVSI